MSELRPVTPGVEEIPESPAMARDLETLLEYLKQNRGFDFTAYKRATLTRSGNKEFNEVVLDATNRRGKPMRVKVTCTQLANPNGGDAPGVILLMEEADALA